MKNVASILALIIATILCIWLIAAFLGYGDKLPDQRAVVMALTGILLCLLNPPTLPKV